MRKSNHIAIRAILREHEDGMTVPQIARILGGQERTYKRSLMGMPDAYIDRWVNVRGQYAAVWCVVVPPANCPRPDASERRYGLAPQTTWVQT